MFLKKIFIMGLSRVYRMRPYMFKKYIVAFWEDFRNEKRTGLGQKMWAYRRGFTSGKIVAYGLTNNNYKNFLSDREYYKLFPLNGKYVRWIDDKLTTKYVLSKYNAYLPKYYFYLKKGSIYPSVDMTSEKKLDVNSIIKVLKEKEILAFKEEAGSLGKGFYKIEFKNNIFYINNKEVNEDKLIDFINSLDDYLVTEFILNHDSIESIFPGVANCVRIQVIKDDNEKTFISNAFMRFGTSKTNGVDSPSAGGVFAIVDINDGSFKDAKMVVNNEVIEVENHPDTGSPVNGTLPKWDIISEKVIEISNYLGRLSWMGFDVVITNEGFKIFEINSHQAIERYQYYYPLLIDNPAADFLNKKLKEKSIR